MDSLYWMIIILYFFGGLRFAIEHFDDILDILDIRVTSGTTSTLALLIFLLIIVMWLPFLAVNFVLDDTLEVTERITEYIRNKHEVDKDGFEKEEY